MCERTVERLEDAMKRCLLGQSSPGAGEIIDLIYTVEDEGPDDEKDILSNFVEKCGESYALLPTIGFVATVITSSKDQFYEKVYGVVSEHPLAFGVGALLSLTPSEMTTRLMPRVASDLGRNDQEQLATFCEEAVLTVRGRVDEATALKELNDMMGILQSCKEGDANPTMSEDDQWIQEFRKTVRVRSWYPNTLVGVLWIAMHMPGPPCALLNKMCHKPLKCMSHQATNAKEWQRALRALPSGPVESLGIPQFEEPLRSLTEGMTTAQILTTTQPNYDELWTTMGWVCRRRVHDKIKAIRECWNPKSGMEFCQTLMCHIAHKSIND